MSISGLFRWDEGPIRIVAVLGGNFSVVFITKSGMVGMFMHAKLLCDGYVNLFHLVFLFTGMLGAWVGFLVCSIAVFACIQLLL